VSVVAEPRFAPCFDGNPDFERVIVARGKRNTGRRLFTSRYHAIINLHGGPTSFIYSCLAWGRRIVAEHYPYAKLYQGRFPSPRPEAHTVESTFETFRWLGLRADEPPALRYEIHEKEAERMRATFHERPYVVIHPGALMDTKRWAVDRFAAVGRMLHERNMTVSLACGPGEESIVGKVAKEIPGSTMMLGLNIPELAELIRGARLYIGNDTGPMHLAAAVGTPTIAVWGSSDSRRWRPWGVEHRVVQNPFECNPCPGYRCLVAASPLCIESVTVEQVKTAVGELLRN